MEISACRLCLAKENLAPLFGKLSSGQFTRNQVFLATGVVILPSDYLPQAACHICIERLKSAIHLRQTSTETQNKLQQIYQKSYLTYENDTSTNLLYEIDSFKTDNEDLNKFLNKINKKVSQTIKNLTNFDNNSQSENNSDIDNEFITNDHLNTDSYLDNELSENSQVDNLNYQTDFDHNYHLKNTNLPNSNVTWDGLNKNAETDLRKDDLTMDIKIKTSKILNLSGKEDKLIRKLKLISKLDKKRNYMRFKSNPALLPARQFKQLFKSKDIDTQKNKAEHSNKILKKVQKNSNKTKSTDTEQSRIKNSNNTKTKLKKTSQPDNEISYLDNESSHPDNNDDNKIDLNSFVEIDDWDENQLKEIEVQKHLDKKRQEKFMSLAVNRYPINGRLQCKVCLSSPLRHCFVTHAKRHFPPEFACETCGKMFHGNSYLRYHRQRMHGQEKPLACPLCDYRGVLKQDLTGHMRVHTGERPYVCDVCGASFRVRGDIVQHMRTHFGVKNIQCPRCPNKLFKCLSDVAKHNRRTHHNFTFFCHMCPKTYYGYSGRSSVRKHLSRVHGIPRGEQPNKLKYTKIPKPDDMQRGLTAYIN